MRVPASEIDGLVLDRLRALIASRQEIADALAPLGLKARELEAALERADELSKRLADHPAGRAARPDAKRRHPGGAFT